MYLLHLFRFKAMFEISNLKVRSFRTVPSFDTIFIAFLAKTTPESKIYWKIMVLNSLKNTRKKMMFENFFLKISLSVAHRVSARKLYLKVGSLWNTLASGWIVFAIQNNRGQKRPFSKFRVRIFEERLTVSSKYL